MIYKQCIKQKSEKYTILVKKIYFQKCEQKPSADLYSCSVVHKPGTLITELLCYLTKLVDTNSITKPLIRHLVLQSLTNYKHRCSELP